jgi:hypothetical protein
MKYPSCYFLFFLFWNLILAHSLLTIKLEHINAIIAKIFSNLDSEEELLCSSEKKDVMKIW